MKITQIIWLIAVVAMLLVSGCEEDTSGNVVADLPEDTSIVVTGEYTTEEDTSEEEPETSEEETTATGVVHEIVIDELRPTPANLHIDPGDTVRWVDNQKNFRHVVVVMQENDGNRVLIGGPFSLLYGETAEFTFEEAGTYYYFSKPAYRTMAGDIMVG